MTRADDRRELFAKIRDERTAVRAHLLETFPAEAEYFESASESVRTVSILLGSPRGGTSVVKQVLAAADNALALPGEHRLFFTLLGLNFPDSGGDAEAAERGPLTAADRKFLLDSLLLECHGDPIPEPDKADRERFAWEWALRLRLQWPELDLGLEQVVGWLVDAFDGHDWRTESTVTVMRTLLDNGIAVNPHYYDLDPELVASAFPDLAVPTGPPASTIVEISPFLALSPTRRPVPGARPVLMIKASSDAYRIPLLHELFEGWRINELHLVRNPLAAVNGLIDGWEHTCFWQHDLSKTGHFGQSDVDRRYWNFDLFDGWQQQLDAPLAELCAWQWADPHQRILANAAPARRILFEDFQRGGLDRRAMFEQAAGAAGLEFGAAMARAAAAPKPVNRTVTGRRARWRNRAGLDKIMAIPAVDGMARRLGYDPAAAETWL